MNTAQTPHSPALFRWLSLLTALGLFVLVHTAKVRYTNGDARCTLLTAQALVQHHTLRLDAYAADPRLDEVLRTNLAIREYDGHAYNYFPPGPSLVAAPFVWAACKLGKNMIFQEDDLTLQVFLAGLSLALLFLLLLALARCFLEDFTALLLSLGFVLGTMVVSTGGTAFWTHNVMMVLVVWVLWQVVMQFQGKREIRGWELSSALLLIWLTRPAGLLLILLVAVWVWLFIRERRLSLLLWIAGAGAAFFLFHLATLHRLMPDYYIPGNRPVNAHYLRAFLNLWFGPSRGFWLYSPFLLAGVYGIFLPAVRRNPLYWAGMIWFLLISLVTPRYAEWAGGWSFGPRLLMDALPGNFLMLLLVATHWREGFLPARLHAGARSLFLVLLLVSIWIHSIQGLFNPATQVWHYHMRTEEGHPESLWDWRNPQFLATEASNDRAFHHLLFENDLRAADSAAPAGAPLFLPLNHPDHSASILAYLDTVPRNRPYFTDLEALRAQQVKGFYIPLWERDYMAAQPGIVLHYYPETGSLGARVRELPVGCTLLLSVKDEATTMLTPESRAVLGALGSRLPELGFRGSWAAAVSRDSVLAEQLDNQASARIQWKGWDIESAGFDAGNRSSIRFQGQEHSPNARGINYVVLDAAGQVKETGCMDTYKTDGAVLLYAEWQAGPGNTH